MSGTLRGQNKSSQRQLSQKTSHNCCLLHLGPVFPSASNWPLWSQLLALLTSQIKAHLLLQRDGVDFCWRLVPKALALLSSSFWQRGNLSVQLVPGCHARCDMSRSMYPSGRGATQQRGGWGMLWLRLGTNHSAFHHYYPPSLSPVSVSIWGERRKKRQYNTVLLRYEDVLTFRNIETY